MASFTNHLSLSLLLITILSSHARDTRFFNKISAAADVVPVNKQPDFLPETENGHGLYGRQDSSAKLPSPATAGAAEPKQPLHRYLPKNYNPVSYVTESGDASEMTNPDATTDNNLYEGEQNYHLTPEERAAEYRNIHYNGAGAGAGRNGFVAQGMSDTRSLENGKYFYDINSETYSRDHPYETMKNAYNDNGRNDNNYYGNGENAYEFNGGKNAVGVRNGYSDDQRNNNNNKYGNGESAYEFNNRRNNNNNYYGNGEKGYEFNGGRNSVAGYENQNDQGIYRP